jgi:hypothetical protein
MIHYRFMAVATTVRIGTFSWARAHENVLRVMAAAIDLSLTRDQEIICLAKDVSLFVSSGDRL